jgi:hypothetical protein
MVICYIDVRLFVESERSTVTAAANQCGGFVDVCNKTN